MRQLGSICLAMLVQLPSRPLNSSAIANELQSKSFQVHSKWCGYESIYFLINLYKAKTFFLFQFEKFITLINNVWINWKTKLEGEKR